MVHDFGPRNSEHASASFPIWSGGTKTFSRDFYNGLQNRYVNKSPVPIVEAVSRLALACHQAEILEFPGFL